MKLLYLFIACFSFVLLSNAATHTQTIDLQSGWNAVWLEVDPVYTIGDNAGLNKTVEEVFTDTAVEVVAMPLQSVSSVEFVGSISEGSFDETSWQVWRRTSELSANSLGVVQGYKAYLVKASSAVSLNISGEVRYFEPTWEPYSYNLIGFGLNGPVTFGQFFADVAATHPIETIFQLNSTNGNWEAVTAATTMVSGRAYWIFSEGVSDFTGLVKIRFDGINSIEYSDTAATTQIPDPQSNTGGKLNVSLQELVLTNISDRSQTVNLVKVDGAAFTDDLRIFDVVPTPGTLTYEAGEGLLNNTPFSVSSQASSVVTLGADRNWSSGAERRENLYKIEFEHHYAWLPIAAENSALSDAVVSSGDFAVAGLWVGEVVVDEVTSLTEPGRPVTETTSSLPLRMILHADASGNVSLLSHVMLMQTKTADESVAAESVLLVNEEKIPFYEGIEQREGKRVGVRFESTSYDMPRDYVPTAQEAIRSQVGDFIRQTDAGFLDVDLTAYQVQLWVEQQATRPISLTENYRLRFPLVGGLGVNKELRTAEAFTDSNQDGVFGDGNVANTQEPYTDANDNGQWDGDFLTLDTYHRSNPFRHAFHPQHTVGRNIRRNFVIQFDATGSTDLLRGTYTETVTGLGSVPLVSKGDITLQRITPVSTLVE